MTNEPPPRFVLILLAVLFAVVVLCLCAMAINFTWEVVTR